MSKLNKIREMLQKALMTFDRISTDKALIEYDGEGEIEIGMAVHGIDEEGNEYELENGEYRTAEGVVYVIEDGKVSDIREDEKPAEPEAPAEEPVAEPEAEPEQNAEEDEPEAEPEEDPRDEQIRNLEAEVSRLETENGELRERIKELEEKPQANPVEEDFENVTKVQKTGNKKLDNLARIVNA